jgi:hypothetical protein
MFIEGDAEARYIAVTKDGVNARKERLFDTLDNGALGDQVLDDGLGSGEFDRSHRPDVTTLDGRSLQRAESRQLRPHRGETTGRDPPPIRVRSVPASHVPMMHMSRPGRDLVHHQE